MFIAGVSLAHEVNLEKKKNIQTLELVLDLSHSEHDLLLIFGLEADLNYAISSSVGFCFFHL